MLKIEPMSLQAPAIGENILQVNNNSTIPLYAVVENLSETNSCGVEWKESDDATTWTTIVGSSQTINPEQAGGQIVNSSRRLVALFAQGNVPLLVHVVRQYNGLVQPI